MNSNIITTIKKELRSIIRDKKTLITLLAMPCLVAGIVFFYGIIMDSESSMSNDTIYNVGIDFDPNVIETTYMYESNLESEKYDDISTLEKAFNDKKIDGYIHYDSQENKYYIYTDSSETGIYFSQAANTYFASLNSYKASNYLTSEDIDYEALFSSYDYENVEIPGNNYLLNVIYSVVFTYIIMGIVSTASAMAISTVPTEKENGTLETIMSFPITKSDLIKGKYLANAISCVITSFIEYVLALISLIISSHLFVSFKELNLSVSVLNVVIGIVICMAASLFISSISLLLAINSKSSKEAQVKEVVLTYLSMIPMFTSLLSLDVSKLYYYFIPVVNHIQILMDIFSGKIEISFVLVTILSSIVYAIIIIHFVNKLYKSEKVMYSE